MWWRLYLLCAAVSSSLVQSDVVSKLVNITQGTVRGYKVPGTDVFGFYSIPYATVPKGAQKFMPPLPPPEWNDIFDAVDTHVMCPQYNFFGPHMIIKEDCLIANVFIPDTEEMNLPVLVNVHGGAFQIGFGTMESFNNLVNTKKIIVVTFNYRLGVHGFLCLGTEEVPGNAGMKDQVALLRWVKQNIGSFGGNPNDITVSGCSAGGTSVDLLHLSGMTDGLIQKLIPESGGNVGPFGVQMDPVKNAKYYAEVLQFDNVDNFKALEEFYKTASFETLISQIDVLMIRPDSSVLFVPCVEADRGTERFLDDAPINILQKRDLKRFPMFYGFANMEGLINIIYFDIWKNLMNEKFSDFLPADLKFDSDEEKEAVAREVKEFYFDDQPVSDTTLRSYVDYFTDVIFGTSMLRSVKYHAENGNNRIYLYEYSFVDNRTVMPHPMIEAGADHCQQKNAVIDEEKTNNTTAEYVAMKALMRDMWLNFITTGNPVSQNSTLSWPPSGANRSPHMSLGPTVQLEGPMLQKRVEFWDKIYLQYYQTPTPPRNFAALNILSPYLWITIAINYLFLYH